MDLSQFDLITGRGSTALYLILQSLEFDSPKIMLPANICEIVVATVKRAGFHPVFVDVDSQTGNAELSHFQAAYQEGVRVVLAVPNYGTPIDVVAIKSWAERLGLFVIEDLCNALGCEYLQGSPGNVGDAAIYSFGYAKILEFGIGGALSLKSKTLLHKCRLLLGDLPTFDDHLASLQTEFGNELNALRSGGSSHDELAKLYNDYHTLLTFRLSEQQQEDLEAYIQEADLHRIINNRIAISDIYANISNPALIHRPRTAGDIYWRYTMLLDASFDRELLLKRVREQGFLISSWYPCIVSEFSNANCEEFPGAKKFGERVINLFTDHRVTSKEATELVQYLNNYST